MSAWCAILHSILGPRPSVHWLKVSLGFGSPHARLARVCASMTDATDNSAFVSPSKVGGGPVGASAAALLQLATKDAPFFAARRRPGSSTDPLPLRPMPLSIRVSQRYPAQASALLKAAIGASPLWYRRSRCGRARRCACEHDGVQHPSITRVGRTANSDFSNLSSIMESRLIRDRRRAHALNPPARKHHGPVTRLRVRDHHVELETERRRLPPARLVVGADGARSVGTQLRYRPFS